MTLTGFTKKYVNEIMAGEKKFDDVPARWQPNVKNAFRSMVMEGEITTEDYEKYTGEIYAE